MTEKDGPVNISAELSALKHEMKNRDMKALPPNMTVQRRPLYHPPIASPYASSQVQKVVYVSGNTPIMSAVKRVRKMLVEIEKRATQSMGAKSYNRTKAANSNVNSLTTRSGEEVLVKASGRAMSQALRIGEWFRTKEKGMLCKVEVRAGSTQAVDDIVAVEEQDFESMEADQTVTQKEHDTETTTVLEGGETTMELLGGSSNTETDKVKGDLHTFEGAFHAEVVDGSGAQRKQRRPKRKREVYDKDNVPEARLRWVKTVEVAISLTS